MSREDQDLPPWIVEAKKLIGIKEIKGIAHSQEVLKMWRDIKRGGIKDDETAWCAAYVGASLERAGIVSTRYESAKSYLSWGVELPAPAFGAVAVLTRDGGGHVGFVVGIDNAKHILLLGGNQSDAVNVRAFDAKRVVSYRYPSGHAPRYRLPVTTADAAVKES